MKNYLRFGYCYAKRRAVNGMGCYDMANHQSTDSQGLHHKRRAVQAYALLLLLLGSLALPLPST